MFCLEKPNSDTKSLVTQAGGGFISAHKDRGGQKPGSDRISGCSGLTKINSNTIRTCHPTRSDSIIFKSGRVGL